MPFDHLLFDSLVPGKTVAEDRQNKCYTSAELRAAKDETVLLFRLDDEATRKKLRLEGKKCCDNLFFFKSLSDAVLIFVELKTNELKDAVDQIWNVIEAVRELSVHVQKRRPTVIALIVSASAAPRDSMKLQKQMSAKGVILEFAISRGRPCSVRGTLSKYIRPKA